MRSQAIGLCPQQRSSDEWRLSRLRLPTADGRLAAQSALSVSLEHWSPARAAAVAPELEAFQLAQLSRLVRENSFASQPSKSHGVLIKQKCPDALSIRIGCAGKQCPNILVDCRFSSPPLFSLHEPLVPGIEFTQFNENGA